MAKKNTNQNPNPESRSSSSRDAGRLYVGNLPFSMTSSELSEIFSQAGSVNAVEKICDIVTNRSRGFGFVTMASVEVANEAIRMFSGSKVGGRTVKVNFPEMPKGGEREVMVPKLRAASQGFIDSLILRSMQETLGGPSPPRLLRMHLCHSLVFLGRRLSTTDIPADRGGLASSPSPRLKNARRHYKPWLERWSPGGLFD